MCSVDNTLPGVTRLQSVPKIGSVIKDVCVKVIACSANVQDTLLGVGNPVEVHEMLRLLPMRAYTSVFSWFALVFASKILSGKNKINS